jgi:Ni/Co efflux regulator RcnB
MKIRYALAALAAIAVAAPSIASAETTVIKEGGHHRDHFRRDFHRDYHRDFHRHHDAKIVIRSGHRD